MIHGISTAYSDSTSSETGDSGRIRTCDPQLRRLNITCQYALSKAAQTLGFVDPQGYAGDYQSVSEKPMKFQAYRNLWLIHGIVPCGRLYAR